jgi:hypothetical protein
MIRENDGFAAEPQQTYLAAACELTSCVGSPTLQLSNTAAVCVDSTRGQQQGID